MAKLKVEIVTPEKRVLSVQADEAIVPGARGLFGVRPGHTPFLSLMEPGWMTLKDGATAQRYFLSGACALTYETVWLRELRLIFGSSTFASAAVTAIFIGGLGLGAALLGRRADGHPAPLRLYGNLELLVAASAAATPLLLWLAR